jgi:hypothetical protein
MIDLLRVTSKHGSYRLFARHRYKFRREARDKNRSLVEPSSWFVTALI